jgi:hypothetical protein
MRFQAALRGALCAMLSWAAMLPAAAQKVEVNFDKKAPFKQYKRYAWGKNSLVTRQTPEVEAEIEKKIEAAADRELKAKGFSPDAVNPDFFIHYDAGAMPNPEGSMATWRQPIAGGSSISGTFYGVSADVWLQVEGSLRFSIEDPSSKAVVWQSLASRKTNDPKKFLKNLDKEINRLVAKGLEKFPPK